jgi:hypothetical protein
MINWAVAAICLIGARSTIAEHGCLGCPCIPPPAPDVVIRENEGSARVAIHRLGPGDLVEAVTYITTNGSAMAGVHYVADGGTLTFEPGEYAKNVTIPIIDNGVVDGPKDFYVLLIDPEGGVVTGPWVRINDNEFGSAVDPLFAPDLRWLYFYNPLPTPDGGLLLSRSGAGDGATLTILQSNGWVDVSFSSKLQESFTNSVFYGLRVRDDGSVFANAEFNTPGWRLVRLFPDGGLDTAFAATNFGHQLTAQTDGKILVSMGANGSYILHRFNIDGSSDRGFSNPTCTSPIFALQYDQKILIIQSNSLVRVNPDGQLDTTFLCPALTDGIGWYFLLRHNGKTLVNDGIQLNDDGSLDLDCNLHGVNLRHSLDTPDGSLFTTGSASNGLGSVTRWDASGTSASIFARFSVPACEDYERTFALGGPGRIFMFGGFTNVDGFSRRGLARLYTNPPERDFRVVTPAEFYRSSGVARVQIVRTGPTTNAASVSFTTGDGTAKAGVDYVAHTGTLNFAPLEVSKEVTVPLLAGTGTLQRLSFNLELDNPSPDYAIVAATPINILPDLRLVTQIVRPNDGSFEFTLQGTIPGFHYSLLSSKNLTDWELLTSLQASAPTAVFSGSTLPGATRFFRAWRTD